MGVDFVSTDDLAMILRKLNWHPKSEMSRLDVDLLRLLLLIATVYSCIAIEKSACSCDSIWLSVG